MTKIIVYGIPNCDTTKKALAWLSKKNIHFSFHDYKQQGINKEKLNDWCSRKGWELIFNKRSTTWRELPGGVQKKITDQPSVVKLMIENNSIIKRPIIETGNELIVGFNEEEYQKTFK